MREAQSGNGVSLNNFSLPSFNRHLVNGRLFDKGDVL